MEERMRREELEVFDKHVAGKEAVTTTAWLEENEEICPHKVDQRSASWAVLLGLRANMYNMKKCTLNCKITRYQLL
jgi:hypothetical protein